MFFCGLGIFGALFLIDYLVVTFDPNSCPNVTERYYQRLTESCPDKYLEWGHDSVKQCINDEMGLYDPRACM
ncbi:hypothetical protein C5F47_02920 [Nitrosopumilus cobalaminigenes]|uniref:Uncharacterized protein n=1 Tax=Nitrosopumilus cobalaminigenes TaxID=1470066 RepID=A0A7D5R5G2_9ARCH|nr:hypothetical protein C5F47_02920 [Nitrosopumilus cobalaminigenes]